MAQYWVQSKLRSGKTHQIVWLPNRVGVRPGAYISLEGDKRRWLITEQYKVCKVNDKSELDKKWKVGGLL